MPKLYIENGPDRGKTYVIAAEGPFFLGRDDAAQVQIRDEMASRRHIQIEYHDNSHHIRDLDSSNGTLLNGRQLRGVQPLTSNDRIQIGDTIITYIDESKPSVIGQTISGYRILDRIGRGGMGTVYRALQTSLDRVVALKILAPHLTRNTSFVNLFIREARAAGALSHPNIVQVYDVGVDGETYFYSMEYMPNGSVEDMLNDSGTLPVERCLQIIRDSALGLEYAEEKGIVHRDIKPGNLMVGADGVIKIGDLGIARSTEEDGTLSQKDGVSGSPHYIAPEQARGHDIDHRADLYALGISFYQLLSGKTPFTGTTPREVILKHIREEAPPLAEIASQVPEGVSGLVHSLMEKDRDQRPLSATVLLEELRPLLAEHAAEPAVVVPPPPKGQLKTFLWMLVGVTVIAVSLIGGIYFWASKQARDKVAGELRREVSAELDEADTKIRRGDYDDAQGDIDKADRTADLPDDLRERVDRLRGRIAEGRENARLGELRRQARARYEDIVVGEPTDRDDAKFLNKLELEIVQLRQLIDSDTFVELEEDLGAFRKKLADLEQKQRERKSQERDAGRNLKANQRTVKTHAGRHEFGLAWKEHKRFPQKHRFGVFKSRWEAAGAELLSRARSYWDDELKPKIIEDCGRDAARAKGMVDIFKGKLKGHHPDLQREIDHFIDHYDKQE